MARPVSWLGRAQAIRNTLAASVRSHYTRKDLQLLFQIQPRAASSLMEAMPTLKLGTAKIVAKEALEEFLGQVQEMDDLQSLFKELKTKNARTSQRKLRGIKLRDYDPMSLYGIPDSLKLRRGHLEIEFVTMEELMQALMAIALILQDDLDEFVRLYEPRPEKKADDAADDLSRLYAELEAMEQEHRRGTNGQPPR